MKIFIIAALLLSSTMCTTKQPEINNTPTGENSVAEKNKQLVNRVFKELINDCNVAAVNELYITDVVDHSAWEGQEKGREGFKKTVQEFNDMFPDLKVSMEEVIASGDIVATRETWKGTHTKAG
jgi:predicted SnoaL-like aldol condensation-catalyzing enzyme